MNFEIYIIFGLCAILLILLAVYFSRQEGIIDSMKSSKEPVSFFDSSSAVPPPRRIQNLGSTSAEGWRIRAESKDEENCSAWDVSRIKFFEDDNCRGSEIPPDGNPVSSGSHPSSNSAPQNVFLDNGLVWGGRQDPQDQTLWIGMLYSSNKAVRCIEIEQGGDHYAESIIVENLQNSKWVQVSNGYTILEEGSTPVSVSFPSATGWRIKADSDHLDHPIIWGVKRLKFFEDAECSGSEIPPNESIINSGHYSSVQCTPENAFLDNGNGWSGKGDPKDGGRFYLGMIFSERKTVRCMELDQKGINPANKITVEAFIMDKWMEVWKEDRLSSVSPNIIGLADASVGLSAGGWRFKAVSEDVQRGWAWDVSRVKFFKHPRCLGEEIQPNGTTADSGHYPSSYHAPENVFLDNGKIWGGRYDSNQNFWIGMTFDEPKTVGCIQLTQLGTNYARNVKFEALIDGRWIEVWEEHDLISSGTTDVGLSAASLGSCQNPEFSDTKAKEENPNI